MIDNEATNLAVIHGLSRDMKKLVNVMENATSMKQAYAAWHYLQHYYAERIDYRFEQTDEKALGYVGDMIQFPKMQHVLNAG
jgi:hypothetical protein